MRPFSQYLNESEEGQTYSAQIMVRGLDEDNLQCHDRCMWASHDDKGKKRCSLFQVELEIKDDGMIRTKTCVDATNKLI